MLRRFRPVPPSRTLPLCPYGRGCKRPRLLSSAADSDAADQDAPLQSAASVAIVGAGPAGLTLSSMLSRFGVPSILLEKASALPTHPQAHFINVRSMEIMRHALGGVDEAVFELCPPLEEWRNFVVCSTVLGRQLARVDNFSAGQGERDELSPTRVAHLSQNALLPLLLQDAHSAVSRYCPSSQILFDAQAMDFRESRGNQQSDTKFELRVRKGKARTELALGCNYIVAADGAGSSIRAAAGMELSGRRELGHLVNVHFRCKGLGRLLKSRGQEPGMLSFVYNEEIICVLVAHNVQKGEWACQIPFFPPHQTAEWFTADRCMSLIQHAIGTGSNSLDIEICSVRPWTMNALVANEYFTGFSTAEGDDRSGAEGRDGGIFLLGDAAHQFPPAGGFGLNTGVQDAHNLAWKLAAVHHGHSPRDLLHSYHEERRPVAMRNAALSVRNLKRSLRVVEALGLNPNLGASKTMMGRLVNSPFSLRWSAGVRGMAASLRRREERAENILRLGRRQLKALRTEGDRYGDARVRSLRRLLSEGGGLPLLFPEHDVGFVYERGALATEQGLDEEDASASLGVDQPERRASMAIRLGGRMPHFALLGTKGTRTDCDPRNLASDDTVLLSTVDLPDQIRGWLLEKLGCDGLITPSSDESRRKRRAVDASRVGLASVLLVLDDGIDGQPPASAPRASDWRKAALAAQSDLIPRESDGKGSIPCPVVVLSTVPLTGAAAAAANTKHSLEPGVGAALKGDVAGENVDGKAKAEEVDCQQRQEQQVEARIGVKDLNIVLEHGAKEVSGRRTPSMISPGASDDFPTQEKEAEVDIDPAHLVLTTRVTDASCGKLGEAFRQTSAEAILIRPDGHVAWIARTSESTDPELDRRVALRRALRAVYTGVGK